MLSWVPGDNPGSIARSAWMDPLSRMWQVCPYDWDAVWPGESDITCRRIDTQTKVALHAIFSFHGRHRTPWIMQRTSSSTHRTSWIMRDNILQLEGISIAASMHGISN
ncbi:hypothetical protein VNO77_34981 [Canavalia gladiata]|uniref:Uncharacterized protein n=1 Tax=Canavalia gladiata TaxID=3824 RepID=A0AAN9KHB5_CANGL